MSHSHAGHSHGASADADRGKLLIALTLIALIWPEMWRATDLAPAPAKAADERRA